MIQNNKLKIILIFFMLLISISLYAISTTWFFDTLDSEQKVLYMKIEEAVLNTQDKITDIEFDSNECLRIFSGYLDDHPGIFWVNNSIAYGTYFEDDKIKHSIAFQYTHKDNLEADQRRFIKLVNNFSNYLKNAPNDWFKLYYIYDYLASTIKYSVEYMDQSMWSVFFDGIGVCAGFARSFQYLALLEGIPAIVVHGYGKNNDGTPSSVGHLWVMAKINGNWYHFDPTWGSKDDKGLVDYTYFCRSQRRIELTHIIDESYPIPESNDDSLSYYKVLNRNINTYSPKKFVSIIHEALSNGDNYCTVEFSTEKDLEKTMEVFFEQNKISEIIHELGYKFSGYSYQVNLQNLTLRVIFN